MKLIKLVPIVGRLHWLRHFPLVGIRLNSWRQAHIANTVLALAIAGVILAFLVHKGIITLPIE